MNKSDYWEFYTQFMDEAAEITKAKNEDYAPGTNPFANFDLAHLVLDKFLKPEYVKFAPMLGLMVRVMDKFQRQLAFMQNGDMQVHGEGIRDACQDPVNYQALLAGMFENLRRQEENLASSIENYPPSTPSTPTTVVIPSSPPASFKNRLFDPYEAPTSTADRRDMGDDPIGHDENMGS